MRPLALAYFAVAGLFALVAFVVIRDAWERYAFVPYDDELEGTPRYE